MDYPPLMPVYHDMAEVRSVDGTMSTSSLIYGLWGKSDGEKMMRILECESGMKQWDKNGSVLTSPTNDVGIGQINLKTWKDESIKRGYDIGQPVDNLRFSYLIWLKSGFKAWTCARITGVV